MREMEQIDLYADGSWDWQRWLMRTQRKPHVDSQGRIVAWRVRRGGLRRGVRGRHVAEGRWTRDEDLTYHLVGRDGRVWDCATQGQELYVPRGDGAPQVWTRGAFDDKRESWPDE